MTAKNTIRTKMNSDGDVIDLIETIHRLALDEPGWPGVLRSISSHMNGVGGAFIEIDAASSAPLRVVSTGLNETADEYAQRMYALCPRTKLALRRQWRHVGYDYESVDEQQISRHEFYDWLQRDCGVKYFIGSRLNGAEPVIRLVSVHYPAKHGHASEQEIERFKVLSPHIANAWQVCKLKEQTHGASTFAAMVSEALPWGLIGIDRAGRCIALNQRAERIVLQDDGLAIDGSGGLRAAFAAVDRTLQKLIGEVLRSNNGETAFAGGALSVPRPSGGAEIALQITPGMNQSREHDPDYPAVLVLITDPSEPAAINIGQLRNLFGLSERECQLVQLLMAGSALSEAAESMGIAYNTARVHLRNVFTKTSTRSQADLINKVRSLCLRSP